MTELVILYCFKYSKYESMLNCVFPQNDPDSLHSSEYQAAELK